MDLFKLEFRPQHGTETALVTLDNDLLREADGGGMTLLVLPDLSAAFDAIIHDILLDSLLALELDHWLPAGSGPFLLAMFQKVQLGDIQ